MSRLCPLPAAVLGRAEGAVEVGLSLVVARGARRILGQSVPVWAGPSLGCMCLEGFVPWILAVGLGPDPCRGASWPHRREEDLGSVSGPRAGSLPWGLGASASQVLTPHRGAACQVFPGRLGPQPKPAARPGPCACRTKTGVPAPAPPGQDRAATSGHGDGPRLMCSPAAGLQGDPGVPPHKLSSAAPTGAFAWALSPRCPLPGPSCGV